MNLFNKELTIEQAINFVRANRTCDATQGCLMIDAATTLADEVERLAKENSQLKCYDNEHCKDVKVTNPRNVLVQIPAYIISKWNTEDLDYLRVSYNEYTNEVCIKPAI